ncbi:aspartate kinase [Virgibacillus sp. 179-BFC.A HS]|uniref:Aspartokinase n=1 Tax=Tigheibacillus jepli TaxID=3035914 RepID=A0ABU5CJE5_9BACI|nr:aspartate kinase [Virgibacillus sp. 179-BFC.A HS]MDY0405625.1 aspartate kinase [Virgibacillus sp. 179-BFC.A HS]
MKVAKFGGSSVANAAQIKKVANIIKGDAQRKFIVVSAPGKRFSEDVKLTDILIDLSDAKPNSETYESCLAAIHERFYEIVTSLGLEKNLLDELLKTLANLLESNTDHRNDCIKAFGEDSSAKVVSSYLRRIGLNAHYLNPKDAGIIVTDESGDAQILPESFSNLYRLRDLEGIYVIPGFFGYTADGKLTTFSRGGSDITGSIVAAGVQASLYENFTDVNSVYTVNPAIVSNPKEIKQLTYREMRELSYAGFSVFHDEALMPAFNAKIPVAIKNTNNPDKEGTMIVAEKPTKQNGVVGIASDTGFSSIYISKYLMNRELGFGRKLLEILEKAHISFEHIPSGIDDLTVIVRDHQLSQKKEKHIIEQIEQSLHPDTVKVHHDLAIIMVVGEGMMNMVGVAQKATSALAEADVNIVMINQGSSEVSMMFGVEARDMHKAIKSLYQKYFG